MYRRFRELERPQFYLSAQTDGVKKLWYVSTLLCDARNARDMKYVDVGCKLSGYPVRFDSLDVAWEEACNYYVSHNKIYPWGLTDDGEIIRIPNATIEAIKKVADGWMTEDSESHIMEFKE